METTSTLLELKNVSKRFGGIHALKGIDFDVRLGEVHALVGENGAGKSTMMKILAGVIPDYEGTMLWQGQPVRLKNPRHALDLGIAMIHQELSVMPELTVAENIFLGRQPLKGGVIDWQRMFREAEGILAELGFSHINVRDNLERYPLGVHQLAEIARAITSGARLIIMDEPTSALSPMETQHLLELTRQLVEKGDKAVVYISHFLEEVTWVADRITVLRDGEKITTLDAKEADKQELVRLMLGKEAEFFEESYIGSREVDDVHEAAPPVLVVRGLSKPRAFEDVSFELHAGEILGLYGLIGSGHFELGEALYGLLKPSSGSMELAGNSLRGSPRKAIDRGVAYVPPSRRTGLFLEKPIYQNISLPWLAKISGFVPAVKKEVKVADEVIHRVGVRPPDPLKEVVFLSGGNQQKVAIARWLVELPKVFVVSEPTRGMDVGAKEEVMKILKEMSAAGVGVLLISSEPETILAAAERILVMAKGRIVEEFKDQSVSKEMLLAAAAGEMVEQTA
ncbi:sugar ABC transporter ATP-binding protein [Oceanithermus sp.]